jgi:hypothetical protein
LRTVHCSNGASQWWSAQSPVVRTRNPLVGQGQIDVGHGSSGSPSRTSTLQYQARRGGSR